MAEGEDFLTARPVRPANHAGHIRIDARIIPAVDVRPNLDRAFLEKLAQKFRAAGGNRETDQRRAAFSETPAIISKRIDPSALIYQFTILRILADQAEGSGFGQSGFRAASAKNQLAFQVRTDQVGRR